VLYKEICEEIANELNTSSNQVRFVIDRFFEKLLELSSHNVEFEIPGYGRLRTLKRKKYIELKGV